MAGTSGARGKTRAKTLQERFGFLDADLTTPGHDEIMLWLDANAGEVVAGLYPRGDWTPAELEAVREDLRRETALLAGYGHDAETLNQAGTLTGTPPPRPDTVVHSKQWEAPVLDRTFTVGFVDLLVRAQLGWLSFSGERSGPKRWSVYTTAAWIAFEVKTTIPSLGELIRQVRLYQTYLSDGTKVVVVSPETRWAEALRGQGIGFVAYPGGQLRLP